MSVPVSHLLRGRFYSTVLTVRCGFYHRCLACGGCRHYVALSAVCRACESEHKQSLICRCSPDRLLSVRLITKRLGRPMLDPSVPRGKPLITVEEDPQMVEFIDRHIGSVQEHGSD